MSAQITIDLNRVHPVSGGRWHRVVFLTQLPQPGEPITMMCGQTEEAEYVSTAAQTPTETCWGCDLAYRRQQGIPVLPDHPGLRGRPVPLMPTPCQAAGAWNAMTCPLCCQLIWAPPAWKVPVTRNAAGCPGVAVTVAGPAGVSVTGFPVDSYCYR
jgi:hypothetical protein